MLIRKSQKILYSVGNRYIGYMFASSPKSYYQILDIKKNFSEKQLRSKFLKKARQLHPDHNPSPSAQQQFKQVKQAYQTLKDAQKRYMYDTGISVQPGEQTQIHRQYQQQTGKKYYENRWYRYKKSSYTDARDQFYQKRSQFIKGQSPLKSGLFFFVSLTTGIFGYDYYTSKTQKTQVQNKIAKQIIENSIDTQKKTIIMKKYIQSRAKQHAVND